MRQEGRGAFGANLGCRCTVDCRRPLSGVEPGSGRQSAGVIHHVGYRDPALRRRKLDRDLRLLLLENSEQPDDPFTLFNLGSVFQELGRTADALPMLRRSLERSHPTDSIVRKLFALIGHGCRTLGQHRDAMAACQEGRRHYPDDVELLYLEGSLRREMGDLGGAEQCLLRLLEQREGAHFASVDAGLAGHKARHQLAALHVEQGRFADAAVQWRHALTEHPGFLPAWLSLGELHLRQKNWEQLEATAQHLQARGERLEAMLLRARGLMARQDFAPARQLLEEAVRQAPRALWPHRILSHALLQEGRDWAAAEQALRNVLGIKPNDEEARSNMAVLLRQRGEG